MAENPPAFPQTCLDGGEIGIVHEGMSLRDWFAGQALAGLCANPTIIDGGQDAQFRAAAWCAYCIADDMLTERANGTQP